MTRLAESLANQCPGSLVPLVESGYDSTSSPSICHSTPSFYSPSCMNNSSSSSSSEEHSMLRLAELYEQLAESVLGARRLPRTRRVRALTRRVPSWMSSASNSPSPPRTHYFNSTQRKGDKLGDSRPDSPSQMSDSPSPLHAKAIYAILLESSPCQS